MEKSETLAQIPAFENLKWKLVKSFLAQSVTQPLIKACGTKMWLQVLPLDAGEAKGGLHKHWLPVHCWPADDLDQVQVVDTDSRQDADSTFMAISA